jgi:hypothetical protein
VDRDGGICDWGGVAEVASMGVCMCLCLHESLLACRHLGSLATFYQMTCQGLKDHSV